MAKKLSSTHQFYRNIDKRKEEAGLHKSPEKKKIDELELSLNTSRKNWRETKDELNEATILIKELKSQVRNLKGDKADLEKDIKNLQHHLDGIKKELALARSSKK